MREDIIFKGVNGEIQLLLNETADFRDVLSQLKVKLTAAAEFFQGGMAIRLPGTLTAAQRQEVAGVLTEHGLAWNETGAKPISSGIRTVSKVDPVVEISEPVMEREDGYEITAKVINKTLRSGQKVVHDGSVVIVGDVNPGAQVIAGEDIIILGACRGLAHAGASGNQAATITANKILATQLRIAGLIARAPDQLDKPAYMEKARVKNGTVIIEPANK